MSTVRFPVDFLWGAATAPHQVEGGNVASDMWDMEFAPGSGWAEPSGDTCDHYHRYPEDIGLMAELGLNAYRFGVEWARVEPEDGYVSIAALDHYRRMVATCHQLPWRSWNVLPWPAPVMKPPGFEENGLCGSYSNGPRGPSPT